MKTRVTEVFLGSIQVFVAISAIPAGLMLIMEPDGSTLSLSSDVLEGSPFANFLIPGIFLFLINGIGSLYGAFLSFWGNSKAAVVGMGLGVILVGWILIQVLITGWISFLQPLYLAIGIFALICALRLKKLR